MSEFTTEDKIERILSLVEKIEDMVSRLPAQKAAPTSAQTEIASDFDLDGKFGDEEIRRMPSGKYWNGADFTGKKMSQTSVEFLEAYAKYKSACAWANEKEGKEEKAKYIGYDRKSAARARGWAKRLSDGYRPASDSLFDTTGSDDVPF